MGDSRQENATDSQHAVIGSKVEEEDGSEKRKSSAAPAVESSPSTTGSGVDPSPAAGSITQQREFVAIEIQSLSANPPKGAFGGGNEEADSRICRVCHLSLTKGDDRVEGDDDPVDHGAASSPIELGCACKDDLAFAHRRCAETWFKIKGNRNCEICGELAHNVAACMDDSSCGRRSDEQSDSIFENGTAPHPGRSFWQHRPICNFVLAFIVVILLLPWLFRIRLF